MKRLTITDLTARDRAVLLIALGYRRPDRRTLLAAADERHAPARRLPDSGTGVRRGEDS